VDHFLDQELLRLKRLHLGVVGAEAFLQFGDILLDLQLLQQQALNRG